MSSNDIAVELRDATRRYGQVVAADRVNLAVRKGEFFTLLGASGSGKTTSLRLIAGFEQPDSGAVLIHGADVSRLPAHKRDVHTVFQDYALFPHLNVHENVAFALDLRKVPGDEAGQRVREALALVQLSGYEARKPSELSGGQQQRVALARAIVDRPAVLLLDEPLSALDAKIRAGLREELKTLQRETGITFIYVTHDQEEALTLSDRLAVMKGGRVLQVGTPDEVYEHPADLFVAEFIGQANFIDGRIARVDGSYGVIDVQGRSLAAVMARPLRTDDRIRVMIRPENLFITDDPSHGFRGTIRQSQYLGHSTLYLVDTGSQVFRVLEQRRRGAAPRAEGSSVDLTWKKDEALVYPSASG